MHMANGKPFRAVRPAPLGVERGFAYLVVMLLVAIVGISMAKALDGWHDGTQRSKEKQLLFAGRQIRQAIIHFYEHSPAQGLKFPMSLADLLRDPRQPGMVRYLREIYRDPITGSADWGLVKGASGEIVGVYSQSKALPLKQGNFPPAEKAFEGARSYAEWVFVFSPGRYTAQLPGGAGPAINNNK
jgi:type II secretory pathway pseudopilin PulG